MSIFKPSQKTFSPLVNDNDNEQGPSMNRGHQRGGGGGGGGREIDNILLRGNMIFCYRVNRFLTHSLLSEMFT